MRKLHALWLVPAVALSVALAQPAQTQSEPTVRGNDYPKVWQQYPRSEFSDSFGLPVQQCTSWVAWRAWEDKRYKVNYSWGNARDWPEAAYKLSVPVDTVPAVGSAMVDTSFVPGHIVWVEKINDDGTVHISEYNYTPYKYSERDVSIDNMVFIHFPKIERGF